MLNDWSQEVHGQIGLLGAFGVLCKRSDFGEGAAFALTLRQRRDAGAASGEARLSYYRPAFIFSVIFIISTGYDVSLIVEEIFQII